MKFRFLTSKQVFWITLVFLYLFLLLLNILSPLVADDYSYMYQFATGERIQNVLDIFPSMAVHYRTVNGRIVVHGIVQFFICTGKMVFNLINPLVYLALGYGICRFITGKNLCSPGLFLAVNMGLWFLIPAFGHTVLFMTGSINYLWPSSAVVWFLQPFRRQLEQPQDRGIWFSLAMLPLGFIMGLLHETASGACLLVILLFSALLLRQKQKLPLWWILAGIGCLIGLCILVLAPGNSARMATAYAQTHMGGALGNLLSLTLVYTGHFLMRCALLLLPLLFLLLFGEIRGCSKDHMIIAALLFVCALAANYVVVLSGGYPARAQFTYTVFLFFAFGTFYQGLEVQLRPYATAGVLALLAVCTLGHMCYTLNDVGAVYFEHAAQTRAIEAAVAAGETELVIPSVDPRSAYTALHVGNLSPDPNDWINRELSMYYHVSSIRTVE